MLLLSKDLRKTLKLMNYRSKIKNKKFKNLKINKLINRICKQRPKQQIKYLFSIKNISQKRHHLKNTNK